MRETCPLSCAKLEACGAEPESPECARPFECPPASDTRQDCIRRALAGECHAGGTATSAWAPDGETRWASSHMVKTCSLSCHLLDPASVSRAAVRPPVRPSPLVDAPQLFAVRRRHSPSRCEIGHGAALLDGRCPSSKTRRLPWRRVRCREASAPRMTPRLPHPRPLTPPAGEEVRSGEGDGAERAWEPSMLRVQTILASPRVRLVRDIVTPAEAEQLIAAAGSRFAPSGTARAGSVDYRTSETAMLPAAAPAVAALRQRMAHLMGYPDATLEPLQCVRYVPGQYYKPHHDFYNACETWLEGNRHFTFLVYLRAVPGGGGETRFPRLNITVDATPYAALLFNNCLDNGEPDERTLHEGLPPLTATKYAINGWMHSKAFSGASLD
mmetsp:Transcript_41762/g.135442  ORF Transcript_41762/g.135442 Transcript_41762/m.135442 type:complete len:384 (+) Transcript_41762:870-2021(+)